MADTPRVTVPVDEQVIKRLQEEADHPGLGDSAMVFGPDLRALLRAYRSLSAAPAPESGAVERACVVFQEAIDDFEAEVADVMAEGSERADLWDREITVNIDALKTVMSAALATREEVPADNVTILITKAQRDAAKNSGKKLNDWIGGILQRAVEEAPADHHERNLAMTNAELIEQALSHPPLEAPAEAGERTDIARAIRRAVGDAWIGEHQAEVAADAVLALRAQPPASEDAQPVDASWHYTKDCPAPDTLRVAVEALELAAIRFDEIYEAAEVDDVAYRNEATIHGINGNADVARSEVRQALAALQAEQGAR